MRGKIIAISLLVAAFGFTLGLAADDVQTGQAFNQVNLEGRGELSKALSKQDIRVEDKERAIDRLAELSKALKSFNERMKQENKAEVQPQELYNPILGVLSNPDSKKQKTLRITACQSLSSFARLAGSDKLVEPLGKIVGDAEEDLDVRKAAAQTLGKFQSNSALATDQLVGALDAELKSGPKGDNVTFTTIVIESVGKLGDKRSFVPLMRVIQSAFPTVTKRAAQRALENIKWD